MKEIRQESYKTKKRNQKKYKEKFNKYEKKSQYTKELEERHKENQKRLKELEKQLESREKTEQLPKLVILQSKFDEIRENKLKTELNRLLDLVNNLLENEIEKDAIILVFRGEIDALQIMVDNFENDRNNFEYEIENLEDGRDDLQYEIRQLNKKINNLEDERDEAYDKDDRDYMGNHTDSEESDF